MTTIIASLEDENDKSNPLDHKLVKCLLPEYLDRIADIEARVTELADTLKGTEPVGEEQGDDLAFSEDEIQQLKSDLALARKEMRTSLKRFEEELVVARKALSTKGSQELVLRIFQADLEEDLRHYVAAQRSEIVIALVRWWEKYKVTLSAVLTERESASARVDRFLRDLGYAEEEF